MRRDLAWLGLALFALAALAGAVHDENEEQCLLCHVRDLGLSFVSPASTELTLLSTYLHEDAPESARAKTTAELADRIVAQFLESEP